MPDVVTRHELLKRIEGLRPSDRKTALVAIDGWGASGKSTLARWLKSHLSRATVMSTDDFARPRVPGWEWERFRDQVLTPIMKDEKARYQRYDWIDDAYAEWHELKPGGVLIAEGVSVTRVELGDPWDLKAWIECPYDIRLERGIRRDGERSRDTWVNEWMPEEEAYVSEQRPHERADVVVLGFDPAATS